MPVQQVPSLSLSHSLSSPWPRYPQTDFGAVRWMAKDIVVPCDYCCCNRGGAEDSWSYMHHPTKNDVTSGLNWASQLASQSEKMAFRLFKISLCLWTVCFVSVYTEDGKIFQAHTFDFLSKNFWKREQFSIVLKENNGDPPVIEWRILRATLKAGNRNPESQTRIRNRKSGIRNPESGIRNPETTNYRKQVLQICENYFA